MEKSEFIGVDVSKSTLDVWLYNAKLHKEFKNTLQGFNILTKWVEKTTRVGLDKVAFCFEHTGLYSLPLGFYLHEKRACFFVVSGLLVKRSLGLKRGKSDKIDAQQLSRFVYLHRDELKPFEMPSETIIKLKQLFSLRARLVKQSSGYKAYLGEIKTVLGTSGNETIINTCISLVETLNAQIKNIELEMMNLIKSEQELLKTHRNITSIKGVGLIVAVAMIVSTNNFQSFNTWRQFSCYAGIAPFEHCSGTSYRGKSRVSHLGNRHLKTLLSQSAASSIQCDPEMKLYYQRRLAEGKNKMSTLNIIRNKIVSRIFAVVTRGTPYVDLHKYVN
jgi:transposase